MKLKYYTSRLVFAVLPAAAVSYLTCLGGGAGWLGTEVCPFFALAVFVVGLLLAVITALFADAVLRLASIPVRERSLALVIGTIYVLLSFIWLARFSGIGLV